MVKWDLAVEEAEVEDVQTLEAEEEAVARVKVVLEEGEADLEVEKEVDLWEMVKREAVLLEVWVEENKGVCAEQVKEVVTDKEGKEVLHLERH